MFRQIPVLGMGKANESADVGVADMHAHDAGRVSDPAPGLKHRLLEEREHRGVEANPDASGSTARSA